MFHGVIIVYFFSGFWIRIWIGSVFNDFVEPHCIRNPDPISGSRGNIKKICTFKGKFVFIFIIKSIVSDPHRFYADPDPAFLLNADPDLDPDPTCRI
jgi:hypothetical protein